METNHEGSDKVKKIKELERENEFLKSITDFYHKDHDSITDLLKKAKESGINTLTEEKIISYFYGDHTVSKTPDSVTPVENKKEPQKTEVPEGHNENSNDHKQGHHNAGHGEAKTKEDLHKAYEKHGSHDHDHNEHKQDIAGINPAVLEQFKKFGVSAEELSKIDNFKNFDKAKQSLLAQDYQQFLLAEVKQRARDEFNKNMHAKDKGNFLARSWNRMKYNVRKEYLNAKYEKKAFLELNNDHKGLLEALNGLSNSVKDKNVKLLNGKVVIEYLSPQPGANAETKAVYDKLNELGAEFRAMPGDWQMESATKKEQEKYENKKEEFRQAAMRVIKYEVNSNGRNKKEMLSLLGTAESNIQLDQELVTSPNAEKVLGNIKSQPAILRGINNIIAERGATVLASALGRNILVGTLGLVAFPVVGGVIGGFKGKKRAEKSIREQDKDMRQADAMYKVGNKETAQNTVDAKSMEKKLDNLIKKIKDPQNESIKQELMNSLTARINYTERKLSERKINFGAVSSKTANIFALSQALAEAEALHAVYEKPKEEEKTLERTIDERLDAYLNLRGQKITESRRRYVKNQIIKSATYGALAGAAGVALRDGIHALMDGDEISGGAGSGGEDHVVPMPPKIDDFDLEGDSVPASSSGSIQSFINLRDKMIAHYQDEQRYPEFKGLDKDGVVKKLLDTGRFDKFTSQIMSAHGIDQFTAIAKEHGFLDPNGMGNSAVESASVPKGSFIGMQPDLNGDMQYYIELPDGKQIPIDDNFSEALNQYKGVGLIDTTRIKAPSSTGSSNMGVQSAPGESNYVVDDNNPPDGSLDDSDYGYGQAPGATEPNFVSDNSEPNFVDGDGSTVSNVGQSTIENGDYIKDLYLNNPRINSTVGLFEYLEKNTTSTIHVQGTDVPSPFAMKTPPDFRLPGNEWVREHYMGLLRGGDASAIVIDNKTFMLPRHENSLNKSIEDYNFVYKDHIVRYGEIEHYLKNQGQKDLDVLKTRTENAYNTNANIEGTKDIIVSQEAVNKEANDLINKSFEKHNIFGKRTPGASTRAWARMKDDTIGEHLKARNSGGIRYTGTGKEKSFMSDLYADANKYGVVIEPSDKIEDVTKRIALKAAYANALKKSTPEI